MDFEKFSKTTVKQIDKEVKTILNKWRSEAGREDKKLLPLIDKFIEASMGGKGVRGILVVLGYEIARVKGKAERGKKEDKEIFKVAAAYEIFHSAILAHDDVIDESLVRRGKPSLYKALGGNHNGISQAICLGDCGFFLASQVITETSYPGQVKVQALNWFFKVMLDTGIGEMLDVAKGDVLTIMKLKTARYSVSGPLILGAILSGLSPTSPRLRGIKEFGEDLGIAYQIKDDILGVFGFFGQVGKSVTSDIEEGKNTLLINFAKKKADKKQKLILVNFYGRGKISKGQLEKVKEVFVKTGALDYAKKEAGNYQEKAMKIIPNITKDQETSKILQQMGKYLVERNS